MTARTYKMTAGMMLMVLLALTGRAGTWVLANGDRLTGELVQEKEAYLEILHPQLGRLQVPRSALQVQEVLKRDPYGGHVFVFRGRRGDLIKVLWSDGQGLCLFAKRLERGRFIWPSPADGGITISAGQLGYLLEGIDWRMPQRTWRPEAAG